MLRGIFPIVVGMLVASVAIGLVEIVGMLFYPPPAGFMSDDPKVVLDALSRLSTETLVFILIGYGLGSFLGGYTAAYISRQNQMRNALIVGAILFLGGLMYLASVPSPVWFGISSQLLYLPLAYAGARVGEHM